MSTQKALVVSEKFGPWTLVNDRPIPTAGPKDVLVKVIVAALNPAEWRVQVLGLSVVNEYPYIGGLDGAGIVEEVGAEVTNVAKGDRTLFQGAFEAHRATYQQYAVCPADNLAKIPDGMTFEQAASVPLCVATVVVGIWAHHPEAQSVNFPAPWEEGGLTKFKGQAALIIGGSASIGQYAIQLAKLAGFSPIITTSSLRHEEWLKSLGATHVIDRSLSSEAILETLPTLTGGKPIVYVHDAISEKETQHLGYDALAKGGALVVVHPHSEALLVGKIREGDGKRVVRPSATLTLPGNKAVGEELYKRLTEWLENGIIVPNRVELLPNGLQAIPEALERMKNNQISGVKLVVRPQDTP